MAKDPAVTKRSKGSAGASSVDAASAGPAHPETGKPVKRPRAGKSGDTTPAKGSPEDRVLGAPTESSLEDEGSSAKNARFAALPEAIKGALRDIFSDPGPRGWIELCASVVFVLAAVAVCIMLALAMASLGPLSGTADPAFDYRAANLSAALAVRIGQIGLTILAVSVTTALICRFQSAWSVTFGLIIIGALIVPSSDIVRFILLITGSERAYSEFYRHESPKRIRIDLNPGDKDTQDRCKVGLIDDVIVYRITERLRESGLLRQDANTLGQDSRLPVDIKTIVSEEVISYTARESIANVVARGASETISAIAANEAVAFQTAFQNNEEAREHMLYLRSEGLVDFPFDHFHLARLTDFGRVAFLNIASDAERARLTSSEAVCAEQLVSGGTIVGGAPTPPPLASIRDVQNTDRFEVSPVDGNYYWVKFAIPSRAEYSILVKKTDSRMPFGDPFIYLFDSNRRLIQRDDDSGDSFDGLASLITRLLDPGTYILAVRDLDRANITFGVEIATPPKIPPATDPIEPVDLPEQEPVPPPPRG